MERLERFVKAIEYLKTKAKDDTNEGVAKLLRYKALNYISDVIGGSKEINPLLLERMVEFSINPEWIETGKGEMLFEAHPPEPTTSRVNEDHDIYNTVLPLGDLKVTLKDYVDLLKEKSRMAEESKREAEKREQRLLALLEKDITAVKANSDTILSNLAHVQRMTRADDLSMMEGTDRILGRESGTTAIEAGIVEHAYAEEDKDIDKKISSDKQDNSGKVKQKGKA